MARKSAFSRDDIIQAGFRLVDKMGREHLTARNVAEELGSSTAPVYSNFSNMEELELAIGDEAMKRVFEATELVNSAQPFLNIGLGILDFAWDHPRWYEALFLVKSLQNDHGFKIMELLLDEMSTMEEFADFELTERIIVLKKMAIFTHGLATEICIGGGADQSREEGRILLEEVGETIVRDAQQRTNRSPQNKIVLGTLCHWNNSKPTTKEEDGNV